MKNVLKISSIAILAITLVIPLSASAKSGKDNKDNNQRLKLRTKLTAADGVETAAKAMVRRNARTWSNKSRDRVKGKINFDLASTVPAAADEAGAAAADLSTPDKSLF